jgi:hypothetical protein
MKIPADAIISAAKLSDYLLTPRPWDDKSKFLGQAGFTRDAPEQLGAAIRQLAADAEAIEDGENEYGCFYRNVGPIVGPNGLSLQVVLIWLQWKVDGTLHFVTLKPARGNP